MFAGEREDISKNTIAKKYEECFLVRDVTSALRRRRNRRGRRRRGEEREIKMCLAQLYFIRRAQLLFSLLVNSRLAHS
jgi:hypothetical protein